MEDDFRSSRLEWFCRVALWEGVSYLLLLAVAMPIKYGLGIPEPVKYVGWAHGLLFMLYVGLLLDVTLRFRWTWKRFALFFVASLLPAAPFWVERSLRLEAREAR